MREHRCRRVTTQCNDTTLSAEFSDDTGQLRVLRNGELMREWFPPKSWMAIASVAGARNWGTRPDEHELHALLDSQLHLLVGT
jgi:hypothetical protein